MHRRYGGWAWWRIIAGMRWVFIVVACVAVAVSIVFVLDRRPKPRYAYPADAESDFKDEVQANASPSAESLDLTFTDFKGNRVALADYRGKQNVVLVFTRGFAGYVCPHCTAQTSRLIARKSDFDNRHAAVLVVFPGPKEHLQEFIEKTEREAKEKMRKTATVPFPILLDVDFKAVDQLDLRDDLAKPSTFIFDKQGDLRFAYVGSNSADRPSVKAMLSQLDTMESESH
jgi:peroxiredoxin